MNRISNYHGSVMIALTQNDLHVDMDCIMNALQRADIFYDS